MVQMIGLFLTVSISIYIYINMYIYLCLMQGTVVWVDKYSNTWKWNLEYGSLIKFWLKKVVTIDIVPMFFFLNYILLHSSTIFNLRVIVYKSELSFIYLLFLGHWVVTFLVLLYLDWDSHWTCLVGLCSCLFGVLQMRLY